MYENFQTSKKIIMATIYCRLREDSWDSRPHTRPLNIRPVCNPTQWVLELQPMFHLFNALWIVYKTRMIPNYTWSVDNGFNVEGKIRWCRWDPTQLRTHRHMCDLPFQGCSCRRCHCTNTEKTLLHRITSSTQGGNNGASPQLGDKLVQWVCVCVCVCPGLQWRGFKL